MSLFSRGSFHLHSGTIADWKIDCDFLSNEDIQTLAEMIRKLVGPYASVEGIPTGGLRLSRYLEPAPVLRGPHLIVDDVLTTGRSMQEAREQRMTSSRYSNQHVIGAVLFARGPCPYWVQAVFSLPRETWVGSCAGR